MRKKKLGDHEKRMQKIGGAIRLLRARDRLSIREFAQKAGVNHSDVFRLETGASNNPSVYLIGSIAQALGMTIDELMNFSARECPTCKGSGWIPEGEGSQIRDITGQTKEDLESQIWEIHQALTKAGEYPNKYETFSEAIEALSQRGEGREDRIWEIINKMISVKNAIATLEDYRQLDKYIDSLEVIVKEKENR